MLLPRPQRQASSVCATPAGAVPTRLHRRRSNGANIDLADEFTKTIVTQRAYSANARVFTTTDEMLDELIRISR
jgi:flagellar hook-associated protein FlgK